MRDLLYIREFSSNEGSLVTICGLTFSEFVSGVERPLNLLVLRSLFPDSISFHEINFDGIRDDLEDSRFNDLEKLLASPNYLDGDFCWIDYRNEKELLEIPDLQLAEICFLALQGQTSELAFLEQPR